MHTVAYDHQIFSLQEVGGISRYFCEIAARVPQRSDWRSRIVAPIHYNEYLAASRAPQFGLHLRMRVPRTGRLYRAANALLGPPLLRAVGADLLHRTYYSTSPRPSRGRLVVTVFDMIHELFPEQFPANDPTRARKRQCVEAADHVICISRSTADDLVRLTGVPRHKITVTHLGYSDAFGCAEGASARATPERPYLLFVGHRGGYKNFSRVLEAYGASPRLRAEFDLIAFGGFPFTENELNRIGALKLRANAVRREVGSDTDLAHAYTGARLFVYPSEYEGFGIPPLEAMTCGCPVACSNTSSIPEVVGSAGEYFDPISVDAIRSALERLVEDEDRRRALVAAGDLQRQRFSWDRCADETLAVYRTVSEGPAQFGANSNTP